MKYLFLAAGFVFLGLGIVGIYLPLMPATPFLLIATACFARGSEKFNNYFRSTKLFKKNIEPILQRKGMTKQRKAKILGIITLMISISFILINHMHARICLAIVLLIHYWYFIFKIKTVESEN